MHSCIVNEEISNEMVRSLHVSLALVGSRITLCVLIVSMVVRGDQGLRSLVLPSGALLILPSY
jgi:hypothetical protein